MAHTLDDILEVATVIPVLTVGNLQRAAPLAQALAAGGLRVVEITWRTPAALDALREMKAAAPDLIVGMGTIRAPDQIGQCLAAGADFLVSPGLTPALAAALIDSGLPCLPGIATTSEAMVAAEAGFEALKFFPAEQAGGIAFLKSIYGPLADIRFCPTGSIGRDLAPDYLALPNVACVGGSWIATGAMVKAGDWDTVKANARIAAGMG